jgi:hypothetical protein
MSEHAVDGCGEVTPEKTGPCRHRRRRHRLRPQGLAGMKAGVSSRPVLPVMRHSYQREPDQDAGKGAPHNRSNHRGFIFALKPFGEVLPVLMTQYPAGSSHVDAMQQPRGIKPDYCADSRHRQAYEAQVDQQVLNPAQRSPFQAGVLPDGPTLLALRAKRDEGSRGFPARAMG